MTKCRGKIKSDAVKNSNHFLPGGIGGASQGCSAAITS